MSVPPPGFPPQAYPPPTGSYPPGSYGSYPGYGPYPPYQPSLPPYAVQPPAPYPPPTQPNGLSIAALVLGILGLLLSFIPFFGIGAIALGAVGLVLGIVALVQHHTKGMAIAGIVLSAIALVIGSIQIVVVGVVANRVEQAVNTEHTVVFGAMNASGTADVTYGAGVDQTTVSFTGDWTQQITARNLQVVATMTVSGGTEQLQTCQITVDGVLVDRESSLGFVTCSASLVGN